jgi:ADP-ribosylglycohydrolase
MERLIRQDRYVACLLAGAAGDALGGVVEFMPLIQIRRAFGPAGITEYSRDDGGIGRITDDTQMTLYTAAAVLDAENTTPGSFEGMEPTVGRELSSAYLHWLNSQGIATSIPLLGGRAARLRTIEALNHRRAPGTTCLESLAARVGLAADPIHNDRKGCGGVMRVAPIGLLAAGLPHGARVAFVWGQRAAAITHGHPTGYLAAGATALIIAELASGRSLPEAVATALLLLQSAPGHEETTAALEQALAAAADAAPSARVLESLGAGWVAEEALAMAVYCALVSPTLEAGIVLAANHSGDSDSTAAVAGQFLGLMYGTESVPSRWLDTLECRSTITDLARQLADAVAAR